MSMSSRLIAAAACAAASVAVPTDAGASEGAQLASGHGCLNCHYAENHSAPTLRRLSDQVARKGSSLEALQHMLAEMREQDAVHTHLMVTDESALAILQWMAQGAK